MSRALIATVIAVLAFGCNDIEPASPPSSTNTPLTVPGTPASGGAEAWLAERARALEALATDAMSLDPKVQKQRFFELAAEYEAAAVYAGWEHDGHIVVSRDDVQLPEGFDPRQRPWYRRAVEAGRSIVTEPYIDAGPENIMVVTIATPIMHGDCLVAVLAMDFEMDTILARTRRGLGDTAYTAPVPM